ncbi:globin [Deinococcus maricopensis]|uniref:Globin n=1 Tax=Deinococcus maricopensis (strain DSM 21211 / LMG 22137 / NRRL B-23946 / LB-34) TaxID=709986 RepID=E8U893_DEIML|nr:globin [Deinococcus maricopensis]ADV67282.1 globin [Deinococcus maricopensis DSM 21211]
MMHLTEGGTLYDRIGPERLHDLLTRFYAHVRATPDLAAIFPGDWDTTLEKQEAFMTGFTGGPPLYHERYGHPRLRARHLPFPVTPSRARLWLACMRRALDDTLGIDRDTAAELYAALTRVATHMVNTPEPTPEEVPA